MHVASPAFLVRHSRYAILAIVTLAAIITPTGDVFNLALFAFGTASRYKGGGSGIQHLLAHGNQWHDQKL
jgi:Sec-independent protein secretion pathway component TatC